MVRAVLLGLVLAFLLVVVAGVGVVCLALAPGPPEVQMRVSDPTGSLDAVSVMRGTHATDPTLWEVHVVPRGEAPGHDPVFRANRVRDLALAWNSENVLTVSAKEARAFRCWSVHEVAGRMVALRYEIDDWEPL